MAKYSTTSDEKETVIRWDRASDQCTVYTADQFVMRKLDKLCEDHPEAYRLAWHDDAFDASQYVTTRDMISFRKPVSEARRELGRQLWAQRKASIDSTVSEP